MTRCGCGWTNAAGASLFSPRNATRRWLPVGEVADSVALDDAVTHLESHWVAVKVADEQLLARRGVLGLVSFDDPWGNHHEIYWGQTVEEDPYSSPAGIEAFLTGALGIGHVFYAVASAPEAEAFYRDAMGFRLTDRFAWGPNTVVFMRATARHHSIGFFDLPMPPGPNHLMLEVSRLEDLGKAYDRTIDLKIPIVNTLGEHLNDPTLSFYVQNPSGFNMELGWQALQVDDATLGGPHLHRSRRAVGAPRRHDGRDR